MKIAMFVPTWPPRDFANGIVTYASYMIPALRDLGHDVYILTWEASDTDEPSLTRLMNFQKPLPFWNRALFRVSSTSALYHAGAKPLASAVKELQAKHGIEILEIEESFGLSYAISSLDLVPVVVRLHGPWFLNKRFEDARRETLERRAICVADAVTSPSEHVLNSVERNYGLKLQRTLTFANPIALPSRQWQPLNCDKNSLLFVGRFDEIKGGDLIIDAFAKLAEKNQQLKLTFVGPDHGINNANVRDYASLRLSSNALSRITFTGKLSSDEIASLRPGHFVTICASRSEVLPYAVLEAMALGCPVVSSNVGGIPEIIRSGYNGILFESQKTDELVSSVQALLDNPDLAERIGSAARLSVEHCGPKTTAAFASKFYEQVIHAFNSKHQI